MLSQRWLNIDWTFKSGGGWKFPNREEEEGKGKWGGRGETGEEYWENGIEEKSEGKEKEGGKGKGIRENRMGGGIEIALGKQNKET